MTTAVERDTSVGDFSSWGLTAWEFDDFHHHELPQRLQSGVNAQVVWDLRGAPPFAVALKDGRAYSYVVDGEVVRIEPGVHAQAACVVEFDERAWQNYVHELRTPSALVLAQSVRLLRGGMQEWDVWSPALQCMYSGRDIYDPAKPLLDAQGQPLDLRRSFTLDDSREEMSHYLRTAGYIVVRGAMRHRLEDIRGEIERIRSEATEGEIFSWWTNHLTSGQRFPYRLMFISEHSQLVRQLMNDDPTIAELVALSQRELVPLHDRGQGAMTVLKPFGVGAKLAPSIAANLGWHTDCGLGGCGITCPSINVGIHLDAANPESSQLWVLAGSHGRGVHHSTAIGVESPKAIPLDTEPGDITIHYSCVKHAGPPPTGPNVRRTLYLPFYSPDTLKLLGRFQSFEQILPGFGSGHIPSLDQVAKEQTAMNPM
ncbi:phytanoyl-CoA dioxygenase family protein [Pseudomonas sp. LS44]|uniref:phytanoyl-CoA dioxygenase family protein n=1 Tax=Pseudomonas sp. LS44 TaxID=1357074 RepID=UPI00215A168A|nr:phytanoyl-CoA dioxygenase family protein [Pseudomonas sp. LS44]UVE17447.1 phytanoyl-CoA dioxygenase family protein [Pseudomonas sp. LS44]